MDTMKDTKMQPATDAVIEELRMLAEDLYVNGYNRYSSAMSQAADELEQLESDLATAEQDSRQKQARIERLEEEESKQAALLDCLNEWKALAKSAEKERDALRTKIEQMEKQKPVVEVQWAAGIPNGILDFISTDDYLPKLGDKLYALPGAKGEEK